MTDCFNSLVGITRETCDCEATEYGYQWHFEQFTGSFVATYKLPTTDKIQLFEDGVPVDESRLAVDGKNLDITDQTDGLYQIWYYAYVPLTVTVPDYNVSKSGLFLTDLLPVSTLQGLKTCSETMWQVLRNTKSLAIKETVQSLNAVMNRKNSKRHKEYQGFIGGDGDSYLTSTKTYAGIRIRTNPVRSGYLRINAIATQFQASGTVNLTIYSGDGTVMTTQIALRTVAGKKTINKVGLTLPMLSDFDECQDYYLLYSFDADNKPRLNKTFCPGCNKNVVAPITYVNHYGLTTEWPTDYRGPFAWNNYLIVGGVETDNVGDFSDMPDVVSNYMNGLQLDVEIGCDLSDGLCRMIEGDSPQKAAFASALSHRWASLVVDYKNSDANANRANVAKGEEHKSLASQWEGLFAEEMNYLSETSGDIENDCLVCKSRISMGAILT